MHIVKTVGRYIIPWFRKATAKTQDIKTIKKLATAKGYKPGTISTQIYSLRLAGLLPQLPYRGWLLTRMRSQIMLKHGLLRAEMTRAGLHHAAMAMDVVETQLTYELEDLGHFAKLKAKNLAFHKKQQA